MSNGKDMKICLIAGLIKIMLYKNESIFPKTYEPFGGDINVKVDLSNCKTKANLENVAGIDTSKLAAKSDLASLKAEVDKLDIDKSVLVPVDLSEKLIKNCV